MKDTEIARHSPFKQMLFLWYKGFHFKFFEQEIFVGFQGVPKDSTTEETIKICLGELDRCYEDNVVPYFLNLNW